MWPDDIPLFMVLPIRGGQPLSCQSMLHLMALLRSANPEQELHWKHLYHYGNASKESFVMHILLTLQIA